MAHVESPLSTRLRPVDQHEINNNRNGTKRPRRAWNKNGNKAKPQKVKGKRGALKCLLEMPDDIMWEVFQHLDPYDLLRLARTTKDLRKFLLCPTTASLWRTCRANIPGLPDCPQDLSEPHYAYLMFELICHFCGTKNVANVVVPARIRCCRKCGLENFETPYRLRNRNPNYSSKLFGIAPQTLVHPTNAAWMEPSPKIYIRGIDALQSEYDNLGEVDNSTLREKWFKIKKREYKMKMKNADKIADFLADDLERKRVEKERLRAARSEEILSRLRANPEFTDADLHFVYDHPSVSQPRELTDQAWKKLEPVLIKFLREEQGKEEPYQFVWNANNASHSNS